MTSFLSENTENNRLELLVDGSIFSDILAMKAAYMFLDRAYFLFKKDNHNTIVQIHPKTGEQWDATKFALEYSDELLATALRARIEQENKEIRETIVRRALGSYADLPHFTSIHSEVQNSQGEFDKDIDEILKELENDPEIRIDEDEINRILAEIEGESQQINASKKPTIDLNKLKDVKKNFQH